MAHQQRAAEALWFTTDNRLAEGCVSNVFVVKDSVIYTPGIETPVLAGIARKTVCEIASANSIKLVEKDLNIDDVLGADEIFLTNVINGISWVVAFNNRRYYKKVSSILLDNINRIVRS